MVKSILLYYNIFNTLWILKINIFVLFRTHYRFNLTYSSRNCRGKIFTAVFSNQTDKFSHRIFLLSEWNDFSIFILLRFDINRFLLTLLFCRDTIYRVRWRTPYMSPLRNGININLDLRATILGRPYTLSFNTSHLYIIFPLFLYLQLNTVCNAYFRAVSATCTFFVINLS